MAVVGALLFTLGLGELLWRRRAVVSLMIARHTWDGRYSEAIDGAGRLGSPQNPEPVLLLDVDAGRGLPAPGESALQPLPAPAPRYAAIVLAPAGKWGSYWQEVARCAHDHALIDEAFRCGLEDHRPYSAEGEPAQIIAVGPAE